MSLTRQLGFRVKEGTEEKRQFVIFLVHVQKLERNFVGRIPDLFASTCTICLDIVFQFHYFLFGSNAFTFGVKILVWPCGGSFSCLFPSFLSIGKKGII